MTSPLLLSPRSAAIGVTLLESSMQPRLRLAISGGGIGGLSLAAVLAKYCDDVDISVYEAQSQFTEIGAGVSIWKRTLAIMEALGLDGMTGKIVGKKLVDEMQPAHCYRKSDQETEGIGFVTLDVPYGAISLHRADMLKVLVDALPPPTMFHAHFNKRLVSYTARDRSVVLHFADGTSAEADVLVGADGIKSATRITMFTALAEKTKGEEKRRDRSKIFVHANWAGLYAYRALVPTEKLLERVPGHRAATDMMFWCGKGKHIVSYSISQGRLVNIVAFVTVAEEDRKPYNGPAVIDVPKQEMLDHYKGWEPEVLQLLNCAENVTKWAISHLRGPPSYVDGRVALLGDAAHPMTPHLGAGAGQAIEDSYILGRLLASSETTAFNLPSILKVYDAIRRPIGDRFVDGSYSLGLLTDFLEFPDHINEARIRDGSKEELDKLAQEVCGRWSIHWSSLPFPDESWKEAEVMLKALVTTPGPVSVKL